MSGLRDYRKSVGLSQAALAKKADIRQATLSSLETGKTRPHPGTIRSLALALDLDESGVLELLRTSQSGSQTAKESAGNWAFMKGLDDDLRMGLSESLIAQWTHSSTALEGNTISLGDTLFLLREGLTVSGKSLREHEEIHGHSEALGLMSQWLARKQPINIEQLHLLHRAVQTGVTIDSLAPVGRWKVEGNGTMAITSSGKTAWHDYSAPRHVPDLIKSWIKVLARSLKLRAEDSSELLEAYADLHLGFAGIHPYADGNGRMARLLANLPLLANGHAPLLVQFENRKTYIELLGDYTLARGSVLPDEDLLKNCAEREALIEFFKSEWAETQSLVQEFQERQQERDVAK